MAGREKNCKWFFADQPNVQEVGPNNAMEQNFKSHPYASLVRESIQNSLDAVLDETEPVRMVFSFREMRGLDFPEFFKLKDHIEGCLEYYPNNHNAKVIYNPMLDFFADNYCHDHLGYIRISDYNTKGMPYEEGRTDSQFYAFVRSAGVSAKDNDSAGGSFGFGKAAYYLLSPISTIIVSTCTEEMDRYFEGATSLCTHTYNGVKKVAFGYYDDQNGKPICDESDIPVPFRRSEPGTDINILGFNMKYLHEAENEMTEAVLRNFWFAIYSGKLEVQVRDVNITKDNIEDLMEQYFEGTDDTTRKTNYYNPRPYFDAVRLSQSSSKYLFFENTLPLLGHVCLYLKKSKGAVDKIAYMRAPLMLVYAQKTRTNYGMYGVFVCDDTTEGKGNDLLRNLENPAHDEWKASNWRVNGRAHTAGRPIMTEIEDFITDCMKKAFSVKDKTAIDIKGLEEFLYIPTMYEDNDDLDSESFVGEPTGTYLDEGSSVTTVLPKDGNPNINNDNSDSSKGHVIVNKATKAVPSDNGRAKSGHSDKERKTKRKGEARPGDNKEKNTETKDGNPGVYTSEIDIPYRTFLQEENGKIYYYVFLHSDEDLNDLQIKFWSVGEESDDELFVVETDDGVIKDNKIQNLSLTHSRLKLRVRFSDNLKHTIKISVEESYEVQ